MFAVKEKNEKRKEALPLKKFFSAFFRNPRMILPFLVVIFMKNNCFQDGKDWPIYWKN